MAACFVIAIDGPAASGKGTLARRLARHFGLPHLDTGLLYRGVAAALLESGGGLDDEARAAAAAKAIDLDALDPQRLGRHEIGEAASIVSAHPAVRRALFDAQRRFAATPPGAVLDGRDIGTVICPEAPVKIFVTATPEVRAERRWRELCARGETNPYEAVLAEIRRRDARDTNRAVAPLAPAVDAVILETSRLDADAAFAAALRIVAAAPGAPRVRSAEEGPAQGRPPSGFS